jgi:sugar lactone lactonase YvrE
MTWQIAVAQTSLLGESPFWHPDEQRLYWVDIDARLVRRLDVGSGTVESWPMPSEPGCIAPALGGGLVIALRNGVVMARQWGGALEPLATATEFGYDPVTTRFNDGKADPAGRFWGGTMYEPRDAQKAKLYSLEWRLGETPLIKTQAGEATVGNGLAWSPDGTTVYWSDTSSHQTRAWDWGIGVNQLRNERVLRQWPAKPAGWQSGMPGYGGRPDGAAVDAEGNYYCAMFEGARIVKLSPAGELMADIPVPAQCPTMPCFGGADLKTLYLTTALSKRPAHELATYPHTGCIFSMQVDVPGLPVNFFKG